MNKLITNATGDKARIYWTLDREALPLRRIYATLRHLRSTLTTDQVQNLLNKEIELGLIKRLPHPTKPFEWFYQVSDKGLNDD